MSKTTNDSYLTLMDVSPVELDNMSKTSNPDEGKSGAELEVDRILRKHLCRRYSIMTEDWEALVKDLVKFGLDGRQW